MCALFKKLGLGLRRGALKLSGAISADDEFDARRSQFNREQKRVASLHKKLARALNESRAIAAVITRAGSAFSELLEALGEPLAEDTDEEPEKSRSIQEFESVFALLSTAAAEFDGSLREDLHGLVAERLGVYRELSNGLVHTRDSAKLSLDQANAAFEKASKKFTSNSTRLAAIRNRARTAGVNFSELDQKAGDELCALDDSVPQFLQEVATPVVTHGKTFLGKLGTHLPSVSSSLDAIRTDLNRGAKRKPASLSYAHRPPPPLLEADDVGFDSVFDEPSAPQDD